MSEKLRASHEQHEKDQADLEKIGAKAGAERLSELQEKAKEAAEKQRNDIEHLAKKVEAESYSGKEKVDQIGKEAAPEATGARIDRTVKNAAYKKELARIQRRLPAGQKALSKFIHNPVVEKVSEIGGTTIARPSGLLGGSLVSLLGGGIIVWMSRHYGFRYNFFVFIALLILGFMVGVIVEAAFKRVLSRPQQ